MHLDMKTRCERCGSGLLPTGEAFICSYECTLCPACASKAQGICPNCGGELMQRPRRTMTETSRQGSDPRIAALKPWLVWAVSFAVWTFVTLAATASVYELYRSLGKPMSVGESLGMQCSQILSYAPLSPFVFFFALRYPLQRKNWRRRSLLYLAGGLVFALAHITLRSLTPYGAWDMQNNRWVSVIWDSASHAFHFRWDIFKGLFLRYVVDDITGVFVPIVLVAHAVSYYRRFRERELHTAQLEGQLAKAHLQALKSQLQPHFLFNTMHSISALMLIDVRAADKVMTRLSDLLRMSLENDGSQLTTLSRELEFVTAYLQIEKVRFEDRLTIAFDIAPDTLDAQVPHLLLQPLAENAVRHGISKRIEQGKIRISASHDEHQLYLAVRDNGPGLDLSEGSSFREGLGLRTTRERLRTLYGEEHSVDIQSAPGEGLEINIRIPFRAEVRPLVYELEAAKPGSTSEC
jgi:two-component system, LytTR family, sensor kinase